MEHATPDQAPELFNDQDEIIEDLEEGNNESVEIRAISQITRSI